jgi:ABC-type phosphate transport system ATPase subunit
MSDVLSATGDVKLAGLRKVYGDFVAVHNLDLVIPQGSFFALLGPSGCGMTSLTPSRISDQLILFSKTMRFSRTWIFSKMLHLGYANVG